jgi:hypothetical protein
VKAANSARETSNSADACRRLSTTGTIPSAVHHLRGAEGGQVLLTLGLFAFRNTGRSAAMITRLPWRTRGLCAKHSPARPDDHQSPVSQPAQDAADSLMRCSVEHRRLPRTGAACLRMSSRSMTPPSSTALRRPWALLRAWLVRTRDVPEPSGKPAAAKRQRRSEATATGRAAVASETAAETIARGRRATQPRRSREPASAD